MWAVVIAVIVIVAGIAYLKMHKSAPSVAADQNSNPNMGGAREFASSTPGWKTYHSDLRGFEISYPAEWSFSTGDSGDIHFWMYSGNPVAGRLNSVTVTPTKNVHSGSVESSKGCLNSDWAVSKTKPYSTKTVCDIGNDLSVEMIAVDENARVIDGQILSSLKLTN